jgi:glycosyltransferase involved in cell wall biosynthesis
MRNLRIAIIGSRGIPARWGGYEVLSEGVATGLAARGHDVSVYCRTPYSDPARPREHRGVKLIYLPCLRGKWLETPSHELLSALHSLFRPFDIYYVLACRASWCYLLHRLLGKRVVFNTDGVDWERRKWGALARVYLKLSYWIAFRIASGLGSDSKVMAQYFARIFHASIPEYLTCGIDTTAVTRREILDEYGLAPNGYFLVACRIEPENNVDLIVRAFRGLQTDKKLVVVGGVNYASQYYDALRAAGDARVVFTGPVYAEGHVDSLLKYCFAYFDGHEVGGTSPGLLRALARGCCVLALDSPFNSEVVAEAGLLWPKDEHALRDQMARLVAHPAVVEEYGQRALRRSRDYSWPSVVAAHERFFVRVADAA